VFTTYLCASTVVLVLALGVFLTCSRVGFSYRGIFLGLTWGFLLLTALLKLVALIKGGNYLYSVDAIILIKNIYIIWMSLLFEVFLIALITFVPRSPYTSLGVLFLGAEFVLYRSVSAVGGFAVSCPCIGNMGSSLGISPSLEGIILSFIAAWMMFGAGILLYAERFGKTVLEDTHPSNSRA